MSIIRSSRIVYWLIRDLSIKYTRSLVLGFIVGFAVSLLFWNIYPKVIRPFFYPIERIGLVGDFTLSTLPSEIQNEISSGLTRIDENGNVSSGLAINWEATQSGKIFTFHLRNDLKWHDGIPVTSKDVNYNIKSVKLTPLDDWTIQANLANSYGPFPVLVSKPLFRKGLIGFGSYRLCCVSLNGDAVKSLKLIPIVNDFKTSAREYHFYTTENQAITAFKLGEVDTLEEMSNLYDLNKWGNNKITVNTKYNRIVTLFFNLKNSSLGEKNYRQALGYALPKFNEERAYQPIPKTSWAYTDNVRKYEPDPTQVQKLLTQSKIGTASAELTISAFSQYLDDAQAIASSWTANDIKTNVKVENSLSSDFEVLLTAIDVPPDPDQYQFWHSTQSETNISGYVNVKIDKLLEDGRQEVDQNTRKKIYTDFSRRLVDDSPALFLYYPKSYSISRKH
jgi:peptide/nickel transport system substrate-binding protein